MKTHKVRTAYACTVLVSLAPKRFCGKPAYRRLWNTNLGAWDCFCAEDHSHQGKHKPGRQPKSEAPPQ